MFPAALLRTLRADQWGIKQSGNYAVVRATLEFCIRDSSLKRLTGKISMTAVSGSQGTLTNYHLPIFRYCFAENFPLPPSRPYHWVSLETVVDPDFGSISGILRSLSRYLPEKVFHFVDNSASLWEDMY